MTEKIGRRRGFKPRRGAPDQRDRSSTGTEHRPCFHLVENLHLWPIPPKVAGEVTTPGGWGGCAILNLPDGRRLRVLEDIPCSSPRAVVDKLSSLVDEALDAVVATERAKLAKAQEAFDSSLARFNSWRNARGARTIVRILRPERRVTVAEGNAGADPGSR